MRELSTYEILQIIRRIVCNPTIDLWEKRGNSSEGLDPDLAVSRSGEYELWN